MPVHDWSKVHPGAFHAFHLAWVNSLQILLNEEILPERFYAMPEPVIGEAVPDVISLQARAESESPQHTAVAGATRGSILEEEKESAVALAPSPVLVQDLVAEPYTRLARHIVIRDQWDGDAVVAVLELVSKGNKSAQAKADQFIQKSVGFLEKGIHLFVLDLHPPTSTVPRGFHTILCALYNEKPLVAPPDRLLSTVSYEVLANGTIRSLVVPLKVGDKLPEMPVFLEPHRFVRIPLERIYEESFAAVPRKFRDQLGTPA